jgi:hypothetical protein
LYKLPIAKRCESAIIITTIRNIEVISSTEKAKVSGGEGYPFCFNLLKYEKVKGKMNKIDKIFCAI